MHMDTSLELLCENPDRKCHVPDRSRDRDLHFLRAVPVEICADCDKSIVRKDLHGKCCAPDGSRDRVRPTLFSNPAQLKRTWKFHWTMYARIYGGNAAPRNRDLTCCARLRRRNADRLETISQEPTYAKKLPQTINVTGVFYTKIYRSNAADQGRDPNALGHVTGTILRGNLQEKCCAAEAASRQSSGPTS